MAPGIPDQRDATPARIAADGVSRWSERVDAYRDRRRYWLSDGAPVQSRSVLRCMSPRLLWAKWVTNHQYLALSGESATLLSGRGKLASARAQRSKNTIRKGRGLAGAGCRSFQ